LYLGSFACLTVTRYAAVFHAGCDGGHPKRARG
jgi:hypothetical protein